MQYIVSLLADGQLVLLEDVVHAQVQLAAHQFAAPHQVDQHLQLPRQLLVHLRLEAAHLPHLPLQQRVNFLSLLFQSNPIIEAVGTFFELHLLLPHLPHEVLDIGQLVHALLLLLREHQDLVFCADDGGGDFFAFH